jgi:protein tyrosine phosphatase
MEQTGEKILSQRPLQTGGTRIPQLVESTLLASRGGEKVELTHLHYDGWIDRNPMPSIELFDTLMHRAKTLSPSQSSPIAVNCRGGIGRTGVFLVSHFLLTQIINQLEEKTPVDSLKVNVADAIYMFRGERKRVLSGSKELVQVIEYLSGIYDQIRELGVEKFLTHYR